MTLVAQSIFMLANAQNLEQTAAQSNPLVLLTLVLLPVNQQKSQGDFARHNPPHSQLAAFIRSIRVFVV